MKLQQTIGNSISCKGIGLHSGKEVTLTLKPSEPDSGIRFVRVDLPNSPVILAMNSQVVDTCLSTSIGYNGYRISTVEHLLAALSGMGIDNVSIEIDSAEVPIMDGSAGPFTLLLKQAGLRIQRKPKNFLMVRKPIRVEEGDKYILLLPSSELKISYTIDFSHPLLKDQSYTLVVKDKTFLKEISRARTFGFLEEVQTMQEKGFARGGSLDNAIVIGSTRILNEEGLRYHDEFVRHKILDLIGDLSLVGRPILGHFIARKSGHALNHRLIDQLLSDKDNYKVVQLLNSEKKEKKEEDLILGSIGRLDPVSTSL